MIVFTGAVKKNSDKVREHMKAFKDDKDQIIWGPDVNESGEKIPPKNGFKNRLIVNFLDPDNGKGQIVKTCQEVAEDVKVGNTVLDDITIENIDARLHKGVWGLPDPDLVCYFGGLCGTYGLLPWQTRLTEFLSIPTQSTIVAPDFARILYRYSKCEQRFGK